MSESGDEVVFEATGSIETEVVQITFEPIAVPATFGHIVVSACLEEGKSQRSRYNRGRVGAVRAGCVL